MKQIAGVCGILLVWCFASCIIPIPRTVEEESREKVLPYEAVAVINAVDHVIRKEGFTVQSRNIRSLTLHAVKSGKVAGDSMTVNTGKGTLFGMAMVFDTLHFSAHAVRLAPKKTRLTMTIDCKKWYAKNALDKAFQEVQTKLFLEDSN